MTIRRDIAELADKGLLRRVHGGAVSTSTLLSEPLFSVKSQMDIGLKDAIAGEAIKFVSPGDVIAIGGGTTAYVVRAASARIAQRERHHDPDEFDSGGRARAGAGIEGRRGDRHRRRDHSFEFGSSARSPTR